MDGTLFRRATKTVVFLCLFAFQALDVHSQLSNTPTVTPTLTPTPFSAEGLAVYPSVIYPFKGESCRITFKTSILGGAFKIRIISSTGEVVQELASGFSTGQVEIHTWSGRKGQGGPVVASGIYLVVLELRELILVVKVVVLK